MTNDRRAAIVTGAGCGIGRAIARRLSADGWAVTVADLEAPAAATVCDELPGPGEGAPFGGDLSESQTAAALVEEAASRWGRLDLLVNNAGGGVIRPFLDHDDESIEQTIARNLLTTIHCCRAAIPALRETHGRIVNIGAESVRNGLALHAMYNAAKGGVHGLTTGLARDLAPDGVTVNCVAPSIVQTEDVAAVLSGDAPVPDGWQPMLDQSLGDIPMGRPATMDEVAGMVAYLGGSPDAAFVTGQVISVNGGSTMP